MTITKVFEVFDILLDKYGSPYIDSDWKVEHFNHAQYLYLSDLVPDNQGGAVNWDFDANTFQNLKPLIYNLTSLSTTSGGLITNTTLETALQTASSDATAKIFRVGNIGITVSSNKYPVRYLRQGNVHSFVRNTFKAPSTTNVRYHPVADGYQFYPETSLTGLSMEVIKTPVKVSLSPAVNPDFEDYALYHIIAKMIKLAGVPLHDEQLIQDVRLATLPQ